MRLKPLETLLNRNIAASSAARALCERLQGKVMALHLDGLPLSIYFHARDGQMSLDTTHEGDPQATLRGTPLALARLMDASAPAAGGSVHIQGDAEVAQAFSELLKQARPDLEEELAQLIGDVPAHHAGKAARSALGLARRAADTFARNVAEYLQEEGRDTPSRTEAEEFSAAVDTLRDDVARLEARLALAERRMQR